MRHHAFRYACPVLFVLTTALIIGFACSDKSTGPPEVSAPEIASISPERGPVGIRLAIKGEHFGDEIGSILFGEHAPYVALWSDTLIQADAPSQIKEPCYIFISAGEDKIDSIWFVVEYLKIEMLSPYHGLPGTEVTITGQNFGSSQGTVLFDSLEAGIVSWSDTQITAIVPDNSISCHVEVHSGNMVSNIRVFVIDKMTITQIIPNRAIPNTEIEIHGHQFGDQPGTVQFQDATGEVISWSDTLIRTKVPLGASSGNVRIAVGGAKSNAISFNVEELYITHITPESAPYGTEIEIHGTFYGAQNISVYLNGSELDVLEFSDTAIVVSIPNGAVSGYIFVSTQGLTSNDSFLTILPFEDMFEKLSGTGGVEVRIKGLHKYEVCECLPTDIGCDTIEVYDSIVTGAGFDWNGHLFQADYYEFTQIWPGDDGMNEPSQLDEIWYVTIRGQSAEYGQSIDSIFIKVDSCDIGYRWSYKEIKLKDIAYTESNIIHFDLYITYSCEGSNCQDLIDHIIYKRCSFHINGSTSIDYISTDWENQEYPPEIQLIFW